MSTLEGQTALVTGASGGIGGAVAEALAARGVRLVLSGRNRERLEATAERVRAGDAEAVVVAADLAAEGGDGRGMETALRRLAETALAAAPCGGVDLLVHALGAYCAGPVATTPPEELDRQLTVNLRVPYQLTRLLLASLIERRGQIVFVSSSAALRPRGTVGAYAASKAALGALAAALRDEVNAEGVRVLTVYPGRTASAMQRRVHKQEGKPYTPERLLQPSAVASSIVHALELPRTAEVTDLHIRPAYPPER